MQRLRIFDSLARYSQFRSLFLFLVHIAITASVTLAALAYAVAAPMARTAKAMEISRFMASVSSLWIDCKTPSEGITAASQ